METCALSGQYITSVDAGSPAERAGICDGERLVAINGERVADVIDYEYLTAEKRLKLTVSDADGAPRSVVIQKDDYEPLGLSFQTSLMDTVRACKNRCVFCFVDQMPKGVRTSLSFKDDDWRLSFIMGNYVTLTNLSDAEFDRIIKRRVSPLFVSVHTTDPDLRVRLMANPTAGRIMERLTALHKAGLRFHAQVVLCPDLNDGAALVNTVRDLASLAPSCESLAIVPVGLTRFRESLTPLRPFDKDAAALLIDEIEGFQRVYLKRLGTRFVFLSDEWYLLAERPLPSYEAYEDFLQIENGVGLIRLFEHDFTEALAGRKPLKKHLHVSFAGGEAATPTMSLLLDKLLPYGISFDTYAIRNDFFGGNVWVAGLVTGQDLVRQLKGRLTAGRLFIPRCMLREKDDVFLDDMLLSEAEAALNATIVPVSTGDELIEKLFTE